MIRSLLIVGSGGFIGSVLRYLVQLYAAKLIPATLPAGTFLVNVTGSFLIGVIYALSEKGNLLNPEWRIFLAVGICGGFTTFSAFTLDNLNLLKDNSLPIVLLYSGGSVLFGIMAVYLGIIIVRAII